MKKGTQQHKEEYETDEIEQTCKYPISENDIKAVNMGQFFLRISPFSQKEPFSKSSPIQTKLVFYSQKCDINLFREREFEYNNNNKDKKKKRRSKYSVVNEITKNKTVPLEFSDIPQFTLTKSPLGESPGMMAPLYAFKSFQITDIEELEYLPFSISNCALFVKKFQKIETSMENIRRYLQYRCYVLESFREGKEKKKVGNWQSLSSKSQGEVGKLIADQLSSNVQKKFRANELGDIICVHRNRISKILRILEVTGIVIEPEKGNFSWNTTMELMWENLPFFLELYYKIRNFKRVLQVHLAVLLKIKISSVLPLNS